MANETQRANTVNNLRAQINSQRAQAGQGKSKETDMIRALQQQIGSANWSDWQMLRWCYYDYVRLTPAGITELAFFANPLGSQDPVSTLVKTHEQTNFTKVRTLGQVYFIIQNIRTHVFLLPKQRQPAGIKNDTTVCVNLYYQGFKRLLDIMCMGVLQIKLGQKDYFDIPQPFQTCPPGLGIDLQQMALAGASSANTTLWMQQSPDNRELYYVTPPQLVEPEQTIEAKITFDDVSSPVLTTLVDSASPAVDIGLLLEGYLVRPAQ